MLLALLCLSSAKSHSFDLKPEMIGTWVLIQSDRVNAQGDTTDRLIESVSLDTLHARLERLQGDCYQGSKIIFNADNTFQFQAGQACTTYFTTQFNQGGTCTLNDEGSILYFTLTHQFFVKSFPNAELVELTSEHMTLRYTFFNTLDRKTYTITDRFVKEG
ncbi:hypothetical protein [Arundinibacter roseus]|uniref:Lipocalin-like domain-containing protein n=1 Tax=Arundinibacter roseus TaxID=2070510 RepID=A0A4V2X8M0_9BACT|nr:hypothetical protein [Arundinibacter roseus]TDB60375.1 hypothetical protein EZE20_20800 [Arundinibacter roseus]